MEGLLLTLRGPLRSWGVMSLGDDRATQQVPTASAVIGLVGACVGVDHRNRAAVEAWYPRWQVLTGTAVAWALAGRERWGRMHMRPLTRVDYHTTSQSLEMSGKERKHPIVSYRGYLEEGVDVVLMVPTSPLSAEDKAAILRALAHPVYTPYLGRRSNPLSAPLGMDAAWITAGDAGSLMDAFAPAILDRLKQVQKHRVAVREKLASASQRKQPDWRLVEAVLVSPSAGGQPGSTAPLPGSCTRYRKHVPDQRSGFFRTFAQRDTEWLVWRADTEEAA